MGRRLFLFAFGALLSAARAEIPIDLPPDTPTNRPVPGINVPAPLRGGTETNTPAPPAPPPPARPPTVNSGLRLYPPPRATNDWLRLQDQDALPGRFLGWEDGAVRWEVADALRPVRFRDSSVNRWVWAAPAAAAPGADRWVVRLTDGSLLPAQEARLEEKTVVAIGTGAGTLRLPRERVAALYRNPYPAGQGRILHNIEDWELVGDAGARDGVAVNYYGGGRLSYAKVLPPGPVLLEFDWPRTDVQVRLPLQSFQSDVQRDIHVRLSFDRYGMRVWQEAGVEESGGETVTQPAGARPRVGVALHPGTGSMAVYVDGKLVGKQHDGAAQRNVPQPQGISVQDPATDSLPIRTVLITPIQDDLSLPDVPGNADLIWLANGDAMAGTLTGLTATNVFFTGPLGALELPLARLSGVVFATAGRAAPRRRDNDVELHFHDGGQLVAELKEVSADQVIVESGALGRATVPRAGLHGVQLGLHRPAPAAGNPEIRRETQPNVIGLRGGNRLNGQLVGVTPQTVTWQLPHALDPLEFALTNVAFVNLTAAGALTNLPPLYTRVARPPGRPSADGGALTNRPPWPAWVQLSNGDQLVGGLKEVTADQVIVESDAFGRATVPRASVQSLQLGLHQPAPPAANPEIRRETQPNVIGLRGGSLLNGQLVGVTPQTVTWRHSQGLDPLEFALTNVAFVNLATAGAPTNQPPLAARVRITNGDHSRGELAGVDAQSVHFRLWQTTPVRIPRPQVAEVRPGGPPEGVLDAGPIENWKIPPPPDRPEDVLYVRNLPLPPRVRLQFEIEPLANKLFAMAWLYSRVPTNQQRPAGYLLHLMNNWMGVSQFVLRPDGQLRQENTTSHGAPGLGERSVSEMTWLLDTVKGEAFVLLDGKQIGLMRGRRSIPVGPPPLLDGEQPGSASNPPKTGLGQEIRIEMTSSERTARLRSVVVSEWKGGTDFVAPPKADAIRLHDFTLLAGPIEGVRDGMVHRAGQDPVPLARVSSLLFNPAASARARRTAHEVRVRLWNGDELTLANLQATADAVTGTSAAWGEVTLPANAIRRLNFRSDELPPPPSKP